MHKILVFMSTFLFKFKNSNKMLLKIVLSRLKYQIITIIIDNKQNRPSDHATNYIFDSKYILYIVYIFKLFSL